MALATPWTKSAAVDVLSLVTIATGRRRPRPAGTMTGSASQGRVAAVERERGPAMIEIPMNPTTGIVTPGAVAPVGALMRVVVAMAAGAVRRRILEAGTLVAGRAGHGCMLADQWKGAESVVEANPVLPRNRAMTTGAVAAQLAGVRIVRPVAINAGRAQPNLARRLLVA